MSRWLRLRVQLDRAIAAVLLVVSSPLALALMLAIRLRDRGPALIAVPRVGRDGEPIRMWKLRSMGADRPDGRSTGISLTSADDDRITPVGRFLRAWYLDELPQLWNVVRGEMCLLGPRPEAPDFVDRGDPRWQRILEAPPGMAGPTQLIVNDWERELISAASDGSAYVHEVLPVKLAIDQWYVRSASPRLDCLVIVTLLLRLVPGSHSVKLKNRVHRDVPGSHVVRTDACRTRRHL